MSFVEVPVSASVVPALLRAVNDPEASAVDVAEVVASDSGLAAGVLALANSAAFGRERRVVEIDAAVVLVGVELIQVLAVARSSRLLDGAGGLPHSRHHAIETACGARLLAARLGLSQPDAFAAGLLHDVGEMLLWQRDPDTYAAAHATWPDLDVQLRTERGMFGADHATAAREQLSAWGLPGTIVDAVGDHHRPDLAHRDLSTIVAAAEDLVHAHGTDGERDRLGLGAEALDQLRVLVAEQTAEISALLSATPLR